jgi:dsRNA-specific ribonuclease
LAYGHVKTEILSPFDDKMPENPIGTLQEMCMSRNWPHPHYEEGLPHERYFTINCVHGGHRETGKLEVCVALGTLSTVYRRDVC